MWCFCNIHANLIVLYIKLLHLQAFWYTATKGYSGPLYGNTNNFIGLGVVIDTFDNDGMVGEA